MHRTTREKAQHAGWQVGAGATVLVLLIGVALLKEVGAGPTKPEPSQAALASQEKPKTSSSPVAPAVVPGPERLSSAPVPVLAADAIETTVPLELAAVGTVEAYSNVQIKSLVGGQLTGVHFREGQDVRKGDLLFTIDPESYEAMLHQQEANLARDEVQAENAKIELHRQETLVKSGSATQDGVDRARTNAAAMAAQVKADDATIEYAKLQVGYCTIRSPIDGRTGEILLHAGNLVKANDTPALVEINQISPIYVSFAVPEKYLPSIQQRRREGDPLQVGVTIPGDERGSIRGELSFVDTQVDRNTGTIRLKAEFKNEDHRLWPGLYVSAVLVLEEDPDQIVVPSHAIQTGQQGTYVYVVGPDLTAKLRPVTVGRSADDRTIIEQGLRAGERIVTDGQLRLTNGSRVEIKTGLMASNPAPAQ